MALKIYTISDGQVEARQGTVKIASAGSLVALIGKIDGLGILETPWADPAADTVLSRASGGRCVSCGSILDAPDASRVRCSGCRLGALPSSAAA